MTHSPNERRPDDRDLFTETFRRYSHRVFAYARRQVDHATAEDVVAETFLVAWRRIGDLPDEPLPWLLVVARNTIANRRRSTRRAERLQLELSGLEALAAHAGTTQLAGERAAMLEALASLSRSERESVLLVAWDGLGTADAASVACCSVRAFTVRLSRARRRLRQLIDDSPDATASNGLRLVPTMREVS